MTPEIALYILSIALIPLITWIAWISAQIMSCKRDLGILKQMHEHPENTGFGTVGLAEVITANTEAIKALTHYVKWMSEKDGVKVPPPLDN